MNIFVTGATGFLGKNLAITLKNQGYNVVAFGRNKDVGTALQTRGIRFERGDLTDASRVSEVIKDADVVFHCGALSSTWGRYQDFYQANVLGTRHVVDACLKHDVGKLIHVSSPSIYAEQKDKFNITEDSPLPARFINSYAKTKYFSEIEVHRGHALGLWATIIRPQGIFGPEDPAIFPRILRAAQKGALPLIGDGQNLIDVTYVDNVVSALICCLTSPYANGQTYNITNDDARPIYLLIQDVLDAAGIKTKQKTVSFKSALRVAKAAEWLHRLLPFLGEPKLTRYLVTTLGTSRTLNIDKAKLELGYKPHVSIEEGLARFANWWKRTHDTSSSEDSKMRVLHPSGVGRTQRRAI